MIPFQPTFTNTRSLVATYGGQMLGLYAPGQSAGWIASVIGAIIVLFIYGMATGKKG